MLLNRRALLIGGGAGAGLVIAYALWPRSYASGVRAGPGENAFNAFLKIGTDGRVTVVVPQAETGQGVYTALPQIVADELGADWRTVAVEPAVPAPPYANLVLAAEIGRDWPGGAAVAREWARRNALVLTGGSSSVRMFEQPLRDAGAGGRVLLCQAAAARWDVRWEECDTDAGFVTSAKGRLRFAELADEAAAMTLPDPVPRRAPGTGKLIGRSLPRIDTPAKLDGAARFAGDIRLPGLVYAAIRQGPPGDTRLVGIDEAAAMRVPGVIAVVRQAGWAAAVATNGWAAERGATALAARFETRGDLADDASIDAALKAALTDGESTRFEERGDVEAALGSGSVFAATYAIGAAPHTAIETATATARFTGDRLEVWAGTQAPGLGRAAAARAAGVGEGQVTLYPTLVAGGFGRGVEVAAIEQAVAIARDTKRPVQLAWSRAEDARHDPMRPHARARMVARVSGGGIAAWSARIVAPPSVAETAARVRGELRPRPRAEAAAIAGALPPYAIPAVAIDHVPVDLRVAGGIWRGRAHVANAFAAESFVDELARRAGVEPFSFRMGMLGGNPRLARVLSAAAALGEWDGGGGGSVQGIAAHAMAGSYAAAVVAVGMFEGRVRVNRVSLVADVGRVINPDGVRQQLEGGILWGIASATGVPVAFARGMPTAVSLADLDLPRLTGAPELRIEILPSIDAPGGAEEIAVPPIAPAIANALFAATGTRVRTLPLRVGG